MRWLSAVVFHAMRRTTKKITKGQSISMGWPPAGNCYSSYRTADLMISYKHDMSIVHQVCGFCKRYSADKEGCLHGNF